MILWILIGVIIIIIGILFYYYNRFAILENRIDNSLGQIDVQLKRRSDLIPNLMKTVQAYAKHERSIIKSVNDARKSLMQSKDLSGKIKADNQLEASLGKLFAIAENYPNLKANENFIELQRELSSTEDKIAYSRQFYNDSILTYNNLCKTFPGKLFASLYKKQEREYFDIVDEERKNPEVKFE